MPTRPDNQVDLVVIVSGQPHPVSVNRNQRVQHVIDEALRASGAQSGAAWELRSEAGSLLDPQTRVTDAGVTDGATLFLNPAAGAGG